MSDFIRNLLIGEAQPDPYVWAAVLLAHAMIGVSLMATIGALFGVWLRDGWAGVSVVASLYAAWEILHGAAGAPAHHCALDWAVVVLGAVLALCLWERRAVGTVGAVVSIFAICFAGLRRRVR
ncbi:hypothetical protein [Paracoccus marcusii]|uniref:hypothetical protein n=1 Tax=Paracoccus marcusii TaxID=59779 RepID=UPI0024931952|nr:hypothetical protein [Paracoccus marcusii]